MITWVGIVFSYQYTDLLELLNWSIFYLLCSKIEILQPSFEEVWPPLFRSDIGGKVLVGHRDILLYSLL